MENDYFGEEKEETFFSNVSEQELKELVNKTDEDKKKSRETASTYMDLDWEGEEEGEEDISSGYMGLEWREESEEEGAPFSEKDFPFVDMEEATSLSPQNPNNPSHSNGQKKEPKKITIRQENKRHSVSFDEKIETENLYYIAEKCFENNNNEKAIGLFKKVISEQNTLYWERILNSHYYLCKIYETLNDDIKKQKRSNLLMAEFQKNQNELLDCLLEDQTFVTLEFIAQTALNKKHASELDKQFALKIYLKLVKYAQEKDDPVIRAKNFLKEAKKIAQILPEKFQNEANNEFDKLYLKQAQLYISLAGRTHNKRTKINLLDQSSQQFYKIKLFEFDGSKKVLLDLVKNCDKCNFYFESGLWHLAIDNYDEAGESFNSAITALAEGNKKIKMVDRILKASEFFLKTKQHVIKRVNHSISDELGGNKNFQKICEKSDRIKLLARQCISIENYCTHWKEQKSCAKTIQRKKKSKSGLPDDADSLMT